MRYEDADDPQRRALFAVFPADSRFTGGVRMNTTLAWSSDGNSFAQHLQLSDTGGYVTAHVTQGLVVALHEAPATDRAYCWNVVTRCSNVPTTDPANGTSCCNTSNIAGYCNCNPVGCGMRLALVDPKQLLQRPRQAVAAAGD